MIKSIILKEWIKLRLFFISTIALLLVATCHFFYNLNFEFKTIEPETMMWYRFVFLDYKTYGYFKWILYGFSLVIALAQFLPERIKNRVKIIIHLPLDIWQLLGLHIGVGLSFITLIFVLFGALFYFILSLYYPFVIVDVFLKDLFFYYIGSLILYIGASSFLLEYNFKIAILKFAITAFSITIFSQIKYNLSALLWLLVLIWVYILATDSLKSTKEQRVFKHVNLSIFIAGVLFLSTQGTQLYFQKYHNELTKYYILYSPTNKVFAYQRNFGEHQFSYGIEDGSTMNRQNYEKLLPFVYWADLDMQKKLPVEIDGVLYDKETIKNSRLSFSYEPKELEEKHINLYPLINSKKEQGVIPFPEEMFYPLKNEFIVFHHDTSKDIALSNELNQISNEKNIAFPIRNIWGRATNMKTYDLGYIIKDKNQKFFNLRRGDNKIEITKLDLPEDIIYISIYENSQQILAGIAIDKNSKVYILDWNFKPFALNLKGFDYKKMNLRVISDPIYYQVRYDDGKTYSSALFNKEFNFIRDVKLEAD